MFNMTKIRATNGSGKSFYANHLSSNDYYSEHEHVVGYWLGELADEFGLRGGIVTSEEFSLFQRNVNPKTLDKLTQKNMSGGPRFFDFQVAAPKSVSVMSMFDDRLLEAHQESVRIAMSELEKLAAVRVRDGENVRTNNYETTGKLVYAEFTHDTSRALDPQLHTHNVVCNVTWAGDGKYKALESLEMCRAIRFAGKVYHNAMAAKCRELGYETVQTRDKKGNIVWYDLKCVPEEVMDRFSKRRIQIEQAEAEFVAEHGRKPTLSENNSLATSTRSEKMKSSTKAKVLEYQMGQLSHWEEEELYAAVKRAKENSGKAVPLDRERTAELVRNVVDELYERESVLKLDNLLAEVLNRNLGKIDLGVLRESIKEVSELRNLGGDEANPYYAPKVVIERELSAIQSVEEQQDIFQAIAPAFQAFPGDESREKQAELIHALLNSKDRFNLFRGVAGSGKTSTLQEFCKGLCSGGMGNIYLIAPTNSATDVLKQEGFEHSQTAASFLLSKEKAPAKSYVIIDESGLNSLREGVEILKLARKNDYRVLFVGDARQHTAVESGDFFRLLEDYSRIQKFNLTDIHRQQNEEYRRGIFECAMGQFEQAFERFEKQHFIHEGKQAYLSETAAKYMEFTEQGQNLDRAILVAPTHEECDKLTDAVREKLKETEAIRGTGRETEVFRSWNKPKAWLKEASNFQAGMTIGFIRNLKDVGKAGEVAKVEAVEGNTLILNNGKRIYARGASDFIDVGEMRSIELCEGDLIQFRVNLKEKKIYNGTLARVSGDPGKIEVLYSDGKPRELINMPENYAAFDYGWVTTSHKSQGRTAENVIVAAESLDRKAFYVALSRGRKEMSLHCPDKEHLKRNLARRTGERTSIHDLIRDREIPENSILAMSENVRKQKAAVLPDFSYKDIVKRTRSALRKLKAMLNDSAAIKRMRKHRERLFDEYTRFETEEHAVGLIGKVMGKIMGLFKKAEEVPEVTEKAALEHERETELEQDREQRREQERKALWKVYDEAWKEYVEKRKDYHALHGGGEVFELTEREENYRKQQMIRQLRNEAPELLPVWMENWKETAEDEARKSRDVLVERLAEEKRREQSWAKADKEWKTHCADRETYHAELGIKAPFKLWKDEIRYQSDQELCRKNGEYPQKMPKELTQWKERMEHQKRQELDKFWNVVEKQWDELISSRKAFYEERHVGSEFRLWPEEETFVHSQQGHRACNQEPKAIPAELLNWQDRALEEVRRIVEGQARQREIMLRTLWEDFDRSLKQYVDDRSAYQMEFESSPKVYRLSRTEQLAIDLLRIQREAGLVPEYPDWMLVDWKAKADAMRLELQRRKEAAEKLRIEWEKADARWEKYQKDRKAYQADFYPGKKYEFSAEEQQFERNQEQRRKNGQEPESPAWMDTWRKKADAVRQQEYEVESKWKSRWKDFDEKWNAYLGGRKNRTGSESAYLRIVDQRRNAHHLPPEYCEFPDWMCMDDVLEVHWRNQKMEEIRKNLGIHPGDEDLPVDPARKAYYESRKQELFDRIANYDRNVILEKLPLWMKDRNPSDELKEKIRDAILVKHKCKVEDENSLPVMEWMDLQKRRRDAEAEYEQYEHRLAVGPATEKQMDELTAFLAAGILKKCPDELDKDEAENLLKQLRKEEKRQELEQERRQHPVDKWTHGTLEALYKQGRLKELPEGICEREAREIINRITEHDPATEFEKGQIRRAMRDGALSYSIEERLPNLTRGEYRELLAQAREAREAVALERERREREHPRQPSRDRGGMDR